jgi:molybdopterin-containing oxidoreductase family membrane subunit
MLTYSYIFEAFGPIYGSDISERIGFLDRIFGFYAACYWGKIALNIVIPQLLWFPAVRRNHLLLCLISAGIIVGMWLERFVIVIPSLHRNHIPSAWGDFFPTLWDWATLAGSIGLFLTVFFILLRFIPIVSMFEVREMIEKDGS